MSILYDYSWMPSSMVVARCPGLTRRQLDHWLRAGYITAKKAFPGKGEERQFRKREFARIRYMNILVNQLGFMPQKATVYATAACEMLVVQNGRIWLNITGGIVIGLPIFEDMIKEKVG